MRVTKKSTLAMSVCLWAATLQPSMAQEMVRAYALVETKQGTSLPEDLGGLMNCKGLTTSWVNSEVVAYIECNDLKSLNEAIASGIPQNESVLRTILWSVQRME